MKKLLLLLFAVLLLAGCNEEKKQEESKPSENNVTQKTTKCSTKSNDSSSEYSISSEYTIYYTGELVDKVHTVETVESEDSAYLKTVETTIKDLYDTYDKKYGGYNYSVDLKDTKFTVTTDIDYSVMDVNKFAEDQPLYKTYIKDGKITIDGIKTIYIALGATCE